MSKNDSVGDLPAQLGNLQLHGNQRAAVFARTGAGAGLDAGVGAGNSKHVASSKVGDLGTRPGEPARSSSLRNEVKREDVPKLLRRSSSKPQKTIDGNNATGTAAASIPQMPPPKAARSGVPTAPVTPTGSGKPSHHNSLRSTAAQNAAAPATAAQEQPTTPSRNPMSRLQRIFSQSGRSNADVHRNNSKGSKNAHGDEASVSGSEGGNSSANPPNSAGSYGKFQRFVVYADNTHVHHLRPARRQEKLSKMLKDFLAGNSKKREEERIAREQADAQHQLSLVQSWINGYGQEKLSEKKDPAKISASFVEKYGRCQEVIGRGAFGIVRIAHKVDPRCSQGEILYAVKEFRRKPSESQKTYTKRLTSEFCISSSLTHPNVIHTLDLIQDNKGDYCEVMEFCAGGDLYTLIMAAGKLEPGEADCFSVQLMRGVEYMHDMGVAHRDLKPENLLLTVNGSLKITDFGNGECFRMAWEKEAHMTCGLCGSAPYIAPEEYTEKEFDPRAVDVWACGVIYMAMRTGRHLWRIAKKDEDEYYSRYLNDRKNESGYEPIEMLQRSRCRTTLYNILHPNPTYRLTAKQINKTEWCRSIVVCESGLKGL
ncbi:HAL protein kinase Hal4 [Schizosaccharomyces japonicus yFS275]|uniref:non-specific serine/threonine protein kinase n=1 Tax=Schizosaccharomyces japonicus (strain yFS275 / FY16936) TaxID=402676 RepID=B6K7P3_SCHJY|nr:HAL protein kinase Hal4 [Schizosaccharomyces japonicus yFS275]EEB09547.2 HAL protein kinase Hal4 [Schizosaccharomyces japonicus yFS275]